MPEEKDFFNRKLGKADDLFLIGSYVRLRIKQHKTAFLTLTTKEEEDIWKGFGKQKSRPNGISTYPELPKAAFTLVVFTL